jgi:hypothetical protein
LSFAAEDAVGDIHDGCALPLPARGWCSFAAILGIDGGGAATGIGGSAARTAASGAAEPTTTVTARAASVPLWRPR